MKVPAEKANDFGLVCIGAVLVAGFALFFVIGAVLLGPLMLLFAHF